MPELEEILASIKAMQADIDTIQQGRKKKRHRSDKIYPNPAVKQAAYRARKKRELGRDVNYATNQMKEAGYDLREWGMVFQWDNGSTLWATKQEDEWAVLVNPDIGKPRKIRYDRK